MYICIPEPQQLINSGNHILLTALHGSKAFVNGFQNLLILQFQGHMLSLLSPQRSLPLGGKLLKLRQKVLKNSKKKN